MGDALGDQRRPFAAKPPPVLLFGRGRNHHRADPRLAALVGEKRPQQRLPIQPVRLGPPAPPRRRDRGRIDHMALNAVLLQNTMQPEPVQPRLLDRDDRIALAGPDLRLAPELSKQRQKLGRITRRDAVSGHPLALAGRQRRHQPIRTAQFQRYKNCGNMRADSGRSVGKMIVQHRRLQVEWFEQPQSGLRPGRYPLPMESSSLSLLAMTNSTRLILPGGQITSDFPKWCQAPFAKIFLFFSDPNQFTDSPRPVPTRGALRTSPTWGRMRWTRLAHLTNGADADGEVVWF